MERKKKRVGGNGVPFASLRSSVVVRGGSRLFIAASLPRSPRGKGGRKKEEGKKREGREKKTGFVSSVADLYSGVMTMEGARYCRAIN